ncbi:MAG: phosphatase PAP2 family protein [Pseudomonas sp.]|uniref:phosphatase PAP2 family protein n=1 Tax=Pseudomonas abieticivorans TaxID=2931382 RepID=UPI0020BFCA7C|nr:phosphatase PAP2 family protein [Pseudomonas sp. PIA16]MDE1168537.1 phosphatase PAP2 family protein [Pseudomonas sp.]
MNNCVLFQGKWNLRGLLLCNLIPIAMLCFWLWPAGHALCVTFDEWLFHTLNAPLATNAVWRGIFTVASMRPFDIVVGLVLLFLLIRGNWIFKAVQVRQAFFGFIATLILLLVIRALFSKLCDAMNWQHDSISLVVKDAVHLSDLYPNLDKHVQIKDASSQSFPGDHASVLLIWAMFMGVFATRFGQYLTIWGLAVLFSLPRLVAGAHWGQDDYIGGVLMALLALGWSYYTPFAAIASNWLVRVTQPIFALLQRLPLINRLSIVSA